MSRAEGPMNTQERCQTPECMEKMRAAKETRSASTLSECSQNRGPYCTFSGLGDCPNNLILPFPSPEKLPTRTYEVITGVYCFSYFPPSADTEAAIFTAVSGNRFNLRSPDAGSCICTPPVQYQTLPAGFSGSLHSPNPLPIGGHDSSLCA